VLGQRWGLVGTVGRWLALATYYWPNVSSPTVIMMLSAQRWHNATRPTVILTLSAQYWPNATQPTVILTLLVQCWPNTIHANLCQQMFFFLNFKYYLTCAYAIIRSILTKKKFLTVYMVWLILDGHTYLINEKKNLILYYIKYISYG
jgi:hypothetical protein